MDYPAAPLYPTFIPVMPGHPDKNDFAKVMTKDKGYVLASLRSFQKGDIMAVFSGIYTSQVTLHTLEYRENAHVHDPWFLGLLAHCCFPNVSLHFDDHTMWAEQDIPAGSFLTMDYASTESRLYRDFTVTDCLPGCRGLITGYEGRALNPGADDD